MMGKFCLLGPNPVCSNMTYRVIEKTQNSWPIKAQRGWLLVSSLTVSIYRRHTTLKPKAQAPFLRRFFHPEWPHSFLSRELDWAICKESQSYLLLFQKLQVYPKLSVSAASPLGSILAPLSFPGPNMVP